jgi:hypothetical protein
LNNLVRGGQQRFGDGEAKRLGGGKIDDEFEPSRPLNRQISRFLASENAVDIEGQTTPSCGLFGRAFAGCL